MVNRIYNRRLQFGVDGIGIFPCELPRRCDEENFHQSINYYLYLDHSFPHLILAKQNIFLVVRSDYHTSIYISSYRVLRAILQFLDHLQVHYPAILGRVYCIAETSTVPDTVLVMRNNFSFAKWSVDIIFFHQGNRYDSSDTAMYLPSCKHMGYGLD